MGLDFLAKLKLSRVDLVAIDAHMAAIDTLNAKIEILERTIGEEAAAGKDPQPFGSYPSVSYVTGLLIKTENVEIDRFPDLGQLMSYARLNPSVRQSSDSEKRGGIINYGSGPLGWLLDQSANVAVRYDTYLGNVYNRLEQRKNHQIAIVATALKMLVSISYRLTRK